MRDVASQKTAALRMSLDAVERQGMPFLGEEGGLAPWGGGRGRAAGRVQDGRWRPAARAPTTWRRGSGRAREEALAHEGHGQRRAPRPERMQR